MGKRTTGQNPGLEAAQSLGFIVGACVCLILSLAFASGTLRRAVVAPELRPCGRINPNDAPVTSLARLPGIGLTRARAIVVFREQSASRHAGTAAFRKAEDLAQVKGIGPATVEEIRPWLTFDTSLGDKSASVGR